mmetsp:Transcript_3463/g.14263  ORF Transcript_3463/g.14263 Transcript_3463/m.14263 type:complete len:210 (+) Transcript_3463:1406-2035(+)
MTLAAPAAASACMPAWSDAAWRTTACAPAAAARAGPTRSWMPPCSDPTTTPHPRSDATTPATPRTSQPTYARSGAESPLAAELQICSRVRPPRAVLLVRHSPAASTSTSWSALRDATPSASAFVRTRPRWRDDANPSHDSSPGSWSADAERVVVDWPACGLPWRPRGSIRSRAASHSPTSGATPDMCAGSAAPSSASPDAGTPRADEPA